MHEIVATCGQNNFKNDLGNFVTTLQLQPIAVLQRFWGNLDQNLLTKCAHFFRNHFVENFDFLHRIFKNQQTKQ